MEDSKQRIKESLLKVIGDVTFIEPRISFHTTRPKLVELLIHDIEKNLPGYQDTQLCEVKTIEKSKHDKYMDYTLEINPPQLFPQAVHHLTHIVHGFLTKYHHN